MASALLRKLAQFVDFNALEHSQLEELVGDVKTVAAKRPIITDGDRPASLHVLMSGWAARASVLPNGERQILGFVLPGDFCNLHGKMTGRMDHSIVALQACRVAHIPFPDFDRVSNDIPKLNRALWGGTLLDKAILRNWLINVSQRNAYARIANLMCELQARIAMVTNEDASSFDFPLIQEDIGNATSLSAVHVNRTLQRLRRNGLIELAARRLTILNREELSRVGGFDPSYLRVVVH